MSINGASRITQELIRVLRAEFLLDWHGVHGASHWARVRENGLRLARSTGANPHVVEIFAFLHDVKRENDYSDPWHGSRAAKFSESLRGELIFLDDDEFNLLEIACSSHSDGLVDGDVTVLTCWDADRLDLGRVGIRPAPERLCTAAARNLKFIEWAYTRSLL
jgi:uncharacterized protein